MTKTIPLADMRHGAAYTVSGFSSNSTSYTKKLHKMGFVKGTPVELAPIKLSDPIIVQIRGTRVALRKSEAQVVLVEERGDA